MCQCKRICYRKRFFFHFFYSPGIQVIEDQNVVSEIAFQDSTNGASSVVGQFFPSNEADKGRGFGTTPAREARSSTVQKGLFIINNLKKTTTNFSFATHLGKSRISDLVKALKVRPAVIDSCNRFFHMAVLRNFIQGRKTGHVIAACVYMGCRVHAEPGLLLLF